MPKQVFLNSSSLLFPISFHFRFPLFLVSFSPLELPFSSVFFNICLSAFRAVRWGRVRRERGKGRGGGTYLTQSAPHNRAAHTVRLGEVQLVLACIAVPLPSGHPRNRVTSLMHRHITPLSITQQNLIPAGTTHPVGLHWAVTAASMERGCWCGK